MDWKKASPSKQNSEAEDVARALVSIIEACADRLQNDKSDDTAQIQDQLKRARFALLKA